MHFDWMPAAATLQSSATAYRKPQGGLLGDPHDGGGTQGGLNGSNGEQPGVGVAHPGGLCGGDVGAHGGGDGGVGTKHGGLTLFGGDVGSHWFGGWHGGLDPWGGDTGLHGGGDGGQGGGLTAGGLISGGLAGGGEAGWSHGVHGTPGTQSEGGRQSTRIVACSLPTSTCT